MNNTEQPRSLGQDKNIVSRDNLIESGRKQYMAACRATRYGSTPAIRAEAKATAQRLRPLAHSLTSEEAGS